MINGCQYHHPALKINSMLGNFFLSELDFGQRVSVQLENRKLAIKKVEVVEKDGNRYQDRCNAIRY